MRLLLTPRWLGIAAATLLVCSVMVLLGRWQWSRYELRTTINDHIESSATASPIPLRDDLAEWTRVTMTGSFDQSQEILIRNRSVGGRVGYEILTPLRLADGTAVLIDRGWVPNHPSGMATAPDVPAAATGSVTVTGRVHKTESDPGAVEQRNGRWETRRVGVSEIGKRLPYPISSVYVLADDSGIPIAKENNWLNLGYAVQWWLFAAGLATWVIHQARKERRRPPQEPAPSTSDSVALRSLSDVPQ